MGHLVDNMVHLRVHYFHRLVVGINMNIQIVHRELMEMNIKLNNIHQWMQNMIHIVMEMVDLIGNFFFLNWFSLFW